MESEAQVALSSTVSRAAAVEEEEEGFQTASDPEEEDEAAKMPISKVEDVVGKEEVRDQGGGDGGLGAVEGNSKPAVGVVENGSSVDEKERLGDGEEVVAPKPVENPDAIGASKPMEASLAVEAEKDGEAAAESTPVEAVDTMEVEKDGASDGSTRLKGALESKPVEASGAVEAGKDGEDAAELKPVQANDRAASDKSDEGEAESKPVDLQDPGEAKGNEVEAAGIDHSEQDWDKVTVPSCEKLELKSNDSKVNVAGVKNCECLTGDSASLDSQVAKLSAGKIDCGNGSEPVLDGGGPKKDEGSISVESKMGQNYESNPGAVNDCKAAINNEDGNEKAAELASVTSYVVPREAEIQTAADGGKSISLQEVEAQLVLAEDSENKQSGKESPLKVSVSDQEVKPDVDSTHAADNDENGNQGEAEEEEESLVAHGPARVAILESSEAAKQIIKELEEGSLGGSSHSGFQSSQDFPRNIDGQIVMDSDEEVDTDEEGEDKGMLDSAALAALLKAATGASPDGSITVGSSDGTRTFSVDRPAGLGSSVTSLRPGPARSNRPSLFTPSELAVIGEPENDMDEEEKKLHEKVEQIRVKFLRLVQRLEHSPEDTVAAQVLYRLSLAEGIRRGRQLGRAFSLENAKRKALQLEADGTEDLDFSCNILVLGKTGVGKSATINSIFGEDKSHTDAFEPATNSVREISGVVDGVKIRVLDTPGLKASVMEQASNRKILMKIKRYTKKCPPDIVLYVDRLDTQTRDFNDLPLLRSITSTLGSSTWFNAIVALTHAASAPPDGPNGSPLSYEVFIAQRSHIVQHLIRQAAGDMRLMNPVALVENHPACRRNREGQSVLPNGLSWRPQMLLLCYSSKILSEANSLLKLQDPSPGKLFGLRLRSPPLPFLLSSLLQSRQHPKLANDQGIDNGDSDIDLDDFSDTDQEEEEDDYDSLPPFKPLRKAQIARLTKEQRKAYFEEYDYRVKLLQKKQWKEEIKRLKQMKKRGKSGQDEFAYGDMAEEYDQDGAPAAVPVPLPDMVLPPSFDGDNPAYRYRFLEPTSQLLTRPVLDTHGWDHDCGYDGVSIEESLAVASRFPALVAVQITKDKKEFNMHLDSSISTKHGENVSTLAGFDIQSVGRQLAYILRGETKFKNLKKNKTTAGISVTFLGETVATGLKLEDQITIGRRISLVASTGAVRAQGDTAYGANLEARLRDKDYPIGQVLSTLGLSLMRWRGDLALGTNLQSQLPVGRNSKVVVRAGLNNKLSGQITVKTSTSEQLQIALVGILPVAVSIFRNIWPGEAYMAH